MKLPNLSKLNGLVSVGKTFISTHRPEILLGTSITTTLGAVVMAAKGGYKSGTQIERQEINQQRVIPVKEKIQLTWMNYLPAAGLTVGSLGSTTALHLVHVTEKKALATAALSAVEEVKKEFVKLSDEEADKVLSERADENGVAKVEGTDGVLEELYLVRDGRTGRDIWSNEGRIDNAVNITNKVIAKQGDAELNTFYGAAGFEHIYPEGDDWGWSGDFLEIAWSSTIKDDGRPVRKFDFRTPAKECTSR